MKFVFKRLIWLIINLFIISSLIFVLSRLLPEKQEELAFYEPDIVTKQEVRPPLFYFNVHSWAEPDTLYKIINHQERYFIKTLCFTYGNKTEIMQFINTLNEQQRGVIFSGLKEKDVVFQKSDLQETLNKSQIATNAQQDILTAFDTMKASATPYKNYVPVFSWYGINNQYHQWLQNALTGNWGNSKSDGRNVSTIIGETILHTFSWTLMSLLLIIVFSFLLALYLNMDDSVKYRKYILSVLYLVDTIPIFIWAILVVTVLSGYGFIIFYTQNVPWYQTFYRHIAPILLLAFTNLPYATKQIYEAIKQEKTKDYVKTAYAKGLSEWQVLRKHVLKNSLFPAITIFSGYLPALISGALVTEIIFSIAGMGRLLHHTVFSRDYDVLVAIVTGIALFKILSNILADILYQWADPRVKL